MVAVEYDEFGAGRAENVHTRLFAGLMTDLGLDTTYGRYVDRAPCETLAAVNLMSLFGLHHAWRGALVDHFAAVEITSSLRLLTAGRCAATRGGGPGSGEFYDEH